MNYIFSFLISILLLSTNAYANVCGQYLYSQDTENFLAQVSHIEKALNLKDIKSRHSNSRELKKDIAEMTLLFRASLEKFKGAKELFKIIENKQLPSAIGLVSQLQKWVDKYIPGYKLVFEDEVINFPYIQTPVNKKILSADIKDQPILDDELLFELYANKKIPILNSNDFIFQLLKLSRPTLRMQLEKLLAMYQRSIELGDSADRNERVRPFANPARLQFIKTTIHMLVSKIAFVTKLKGNKRQLVLMGDANLNPAFLRSLDIAPYLNLSFEKDSPEQEYLLQQTQLRNKATYFFYSFLVRNGQLQHPLSAHLHSPERALNLLQENLLFVSLTAHQANANRSNANGAKSTRWDLFTRYAVNDESPRGLLVKYGFRFEWLNLYTQIIEEDLARIEAEENNLPGPLFK